MWIRLAVVAFQTCQLAQRSKKNWPYSSSRSSKVDDSDTNRKRICDFLLVINSNFGPILYRLRYGNLLAENCVFFIPFIPLSVSYSVPPLPMFPLEFCSEVKPQETGVMGLLCGEVCVMLTSTALDWSTRVPDWTDGQMDGRTGEGI